MTYFNIVKKWLLLTFFFLQVVINILMNDIGSGAIELSSISSSLEALIPYTDRHFKRLTRLFQDLHLLNYTVNRIKPHNEPKKVNGFNE